MGTLLLYLESVKPDVHQIFLPGQFVCLISLLGDLEINRMTNLINSTQAKEISFNKLNSTGDKKKSCLG